MLRRRLDELAEWELSPSGRLVALHGLSRTHRVTVVSRLLLPALSADFARPGDVVRPVSASFLPEQILGIANLSRRTMLAPSVLRFALVALPVCGLPAIAGLLLGPVLAPILLGGIGVAAAGFFYSLLVFQLRQYVGTGAPVSLTLWRGIREHVATRFIPPPPPPPEVDWAGRLAAACARVLPEVEVVDIADLAIADGTLILSDPYAIHSSAVMRIEVPPGTGRASLAIALIEDEEGNIVDQRTSHAWLRLAPGVPTHWEQVAPTWPEGHVGVDSGAACFTSATAAKAIVEAYGDGSICGYAEPLGDAISEGMEKRRRDMWAWTEISSPAGGLIAFTSGLGDGVYPVFRGLDGHGRLLVVAIDFLVAA